MDSSKNVSIGFAKVTFGPAGGIRTKRYLRYKVDPPLLLIEKNRVYWGSRESCEARLTT